jgi:hypothetical protein
MGMSGLGMICVYGARRRPLPPARTTALIVDSLSRKILTGMKGIKGIKKILTGIRKKKPTGCGGIRKEILTGMKGMEGIRGIRKKL